MNAQESHDKETPVNKYDCNGFVYVNGSTNVNQFTFTSYISKQSLSNKKTFENEKKNNEVDIKIPVKNFKTKSTMMYKDFLKLMKADEYPTINIQFSVNQEFFLKKESTIQIPVELTLAGKKIIYNLPIQISECSENQINLLGYKRLNLTDFGIIPPKKMQGLIKVNNEILINFGIVIYAQ